MKRSTGIGLLTLVLLAWGCGDSTPQRGTSLDLLTLTPPGYRLEGALPPLPQPRHWSFDQGLPRGWRAGPKGVTLSLADGGLLLAHPDQPPWLELAAEIDPRLYEEFWTMMQPLTGQAAECYFSAIDPPAWRVGCRSVAGFGVYAGGIRRFSFPLPQEKSLEGPIRYLRLYPGSWKGSAVVHTAGLEPLPGAELPPRTHARKSLDLQQVFRRCWRLAGAGERTAVFQVPDAGAEIVFAAGTLLGSGSGTLQLHLAADGVENELLRIVIPREGEGWSEHRAPIGQWAGREVSVRFQLEPSGPPSIRLIGSPRVLSPAAVQRRGAGSSRHLLLIAVDALRADRLSLYGHYGRTTPHLARLARRGEVYTSAWSGSSWALPAAATLFTGCDPARLGRDWGRWFRLPGNRATIAERLTLEGWDCAAFVADPTLQPELEFPRGFDSWFVAPVGQHQLRAGELVERALTWLGEHREGRTFTYLQLHDPSSPYSAPAPEGARAVPAEDFRLGQGNRWQEGNIWPLVLGRQQLRGVGDRQLLRTRYDEEVACADRAIGRLLAILEARGMLGQTTVVVTGLHGEELGDRGFWGNGYSLHRESVRVPLIIVRPGGGPGQVFSQPVSLADLMPTLLTAAGVAVPPEGIDGTALPAPAGERTFSAVTGFEGPLRYSLTRWPYRYLFFDREAPPAPGGNRPQADWLLAHGPERDELYRISDDPDERCNLARELPEVLAGMREEAARRLAEGGRH